MIKEKSCRLFKAFLGGSLFVLLLIGGCGGGDLLTEAEMERVTVTEKIRLTEDAGGLVLIVGGKTITSDEILSSRVEYEGKIVPLQERFDSKQTIDDPNRYKEMLRPHIEEALKTKITNIMLYQLARRRAGKNTIQAIEKVAQKELRKYVLSYGGDQAKADQELKKLGLDRKSYIEEQKRLILVWEYATAKLPKNKTITHRELLDAYEQMKDEYFVIKEVLQFQLIDINVRTADPNKAGLEKARQLADKLVLDIMKDADFGKLAEEYSDGHRRAYGGLWKPTEPQSFGKPWDVLVAEADKIKPGQIAGPIETKNHIFIMKLIENNPGGYKPFAEVQRVVERKIIDDHRNEVLEKFKAKLLRQAELSETGKFVDFCVDKLYEMNNQIR